MWWLPPISFHPSFCQSVCFQILWFHVKMVDFNGCSCMFHIDFWLDSEWFPTFSSMRSPITFFLNILRSTPSPTHIYFYQIKQKSISIFSMCIVYSNHCNVIVGIFVCSVYFIRLSKGPRFCFFKFISYVLFRGALGDAPPSTRTPMSTGWETLGQYFCSTSSWYWKKYYDVY